MRVESRRIELSELDADLGGVPQLFNIVHGATDPPSLNVSSVSANIRGGKINR